MYNTTQFKYFYVGKKEVYDKMVHGVKIDMNNASALVTVSMLAALLDNQKMDYLDIISPFVFSIIPKKHDEKINCEAMKEQLSQVFGLEEVPIKVIAKILNKAARRKNNQYVVVRNREYYVNKIFDDTKFIERKKAITDSQESVYKAFHEYLNNGKPLGTVKIEDAKRQFRLFFEEHGLDLHFGVARLKSINPHKSHHYRVARFIIDEHEKNSSIFNHITELFRGFLVYKAIYYFSTEQKADIQSKLKDATFYFDTGLLINALGFDTQEGMSATSELIKLITDSGGHIKTFHHIKDELASILTKYAYDINARPSMRLAYFTRKRYNEDDVIFCRNRLDILLKKLGIEIEDARSCSEIDEKAIYEVLYENLSGHLNQDRIKNDVKSVSAICKKRNGCNCDKIENCKAILITSTTVFAGSVKSYFMRERKWWVSPVMSDMDLAALLWLGSWDKESNIPQELLLSNAYSACALSPELLSTFNDKLDKLMDLGKITSEEALLLRTQEASISELVSLSQNDMSNLDDDMVLEIRDKYKDQLLEDIKEENARRQDENTNKIIEYTNKAYEDELEIERLKEEVSEKDRKIKEGEERKNKAYNEVEEDAKKVAERARRIVVRVIFVLLLVVLLLCIWDLFSKIENINININISSVIGIFVSLVGIVDTITGKFKFIGRFLEWVKRKVFDVKSQKKKDELDSYFS